LSFLEVGVVEVLDGLVVVPRLESIVVQCVFVAQQSNFTTVNGDRANSLMHYMFEKVDCTAHQACLAANPKLRSDVRQCTDTLCG
jgi:hypothetical protein